MNKAKAPQSNIEYVAVRNDDARLYTFSYLDERPAQEAGMGVLIREKRLESLKVSPGLNFLDKAKFEKCVPPADLEDGRVAGYDALSVVDVAGLPVGQAKQLIASTSNKSSLRQWADIETRPAVLEAIKEKLA